MTDTRDPQTEKGQNDATEENLAETAQAPEKTLEEQFREEICPTCTVKAEADETRLRALAEMENFKKRIQRDHDEYMRYASEPVLKDLLPALDSLDLAIQYGGSDETCKSLLTGVIMTACCAPPKYPSAASPPDDGSRTDDKKQGVRLARRRVTRRELGGRPARHFQRRVETGPAWAELFYGT